MKTIHGEAETGPQNRDPGPISGLSAKNVVGPGSFSRALLNLFPDMDGRSLSSSADTDYNAL